MEGQSLGSAPGLSTAGDTRTDKQSLLSSNCLHLKSHPRQTSFSWYIRRWLNMFQHCRCVCFQGVCAGGKRVAVRLWSVNLEALSYCKLSYYQPISFLSPSSLTVNKMVGRADGSSLLAPAQSWPCIHTNCCFYRSGSSSPLLGVTQLSDRAGDLGPDVVL